MLAQPSRSRARWPLGLSLFLAASCGARSGLEEQTPAAPTPRGSVTDFNGDGLHDLVVTSARGLGLALGARGARTHRLRWLPWPDAMRGASLYASCVGDLDGDGRAELALVAVATLRIPGNPSGGYQPGALWIVPGTSDGVDLGRARPVRPPASEAMVFPRRVRAAGRLDGARRYFAVSLAGAGGFVLYGDTGPTFEPLTPVLARTSAAGATFARGLGDLDGDGHGDLIAASEEIVTTWSFARGLTNAQSTTLYTDTPGRRGPYGDAIGDTDGDGVGEVLVLRLGVSDPLLRFPGGPGFGAPRPWSPRRPDGALADINGSTDFLPCGDVDGDGRDDVILYGLCLAGGTCNGTRVDRLLYLGGASGLSERPLPLPMGAQTSMASAGDLDGDGRAELVMWSSNTPEVKISWGSAQGYTDAASTVVTTDGNLPISATGSLE